MSMRRSGAPGSPPAGGPGTGAEPVAPVAGVSSRVITAATRRVARRWQDEGPATGGAHPGNIPGVPPPPAPPAHPQRPHLLTDLRAPPPPGPGPPPPPLPFAPLPRRPVGNPRPAQP